MYREHICDTSCKKLPSNAYSIADVPISFKDVLAEVLNDKIALCKHAYYGVST